MFESKCIHLLISRYAWIFFAKLPGAKEAITEFLFPKYPGLPGYPGYDIEEKEVPETELKPTEYDRYYIQRPDNKLTHFHALLESDEEN